MIVSSEGMSEAWWRPLLSSLHCELWCCALARLRSYKASVEFPSDCWMRSTGSNAPPILGSHILTLRSSRGTVARATSLSPTSPLPRTRLSCVRRAPTFAMVLSSRSRRDGSAARSVVSVGDLALVGRGIAFWWILGTANAAW